MVRAQARPAAANPIEIRIRQFEGIVIFKPIKCRAEVSGASLAILIMPAREAPRPKVPRSSNASIIVMEARW